MAKRRLKYRKQSRRLMAVSASRTHNGHMYADINGFRRDLGVDFINFLKRLDDKEDLKRFVHQIQPFSAQWNAFRKKHITSCHIKRLLSWKRFSPYIYGYVTKYIKGCTPNRGMLLESPIRTILIENGYQIEYSDKLWVHKFVKWLSCTTDGVIMDGGKMVALLEIKTYTSAVNLKRDINISNSTVSLNPHSRVYYQVQIAAEIIDVPYIMLVYEYQSRVNKVVFKRDLDFLWNIFDSLREIYLRHIIPYNLYGLPVFTHKKSSLRGEYFSVATYHKILNFLYANSSKFEKSGSDHMFHYYPTIKPSDANNTYFEMFLHYSLYTKVLEADLLISKKSQLVLDSHASQKA